MSDRADRVLVRVPASSANLGPGYDSFGLALGIYDEVTAERSASGLRIGVAGVGAGTLPEDETHLVVRAAAAAFRAMGEPVPDLDLRCTNAIPHGSGQGSSAAAVVAGILLARALTPDGTHRMPDGLVLGLAARLEGHPDNVAPALFGGFTIAWESATGPAEATPAGSALHAGGVRSVRLDPHPGLRLMLFNTERTCATSTARAAVPRLIPHADAAANAARAALLVHAITNEPALLFDATEDRLHQRYRATVMPESLALLGRLRDAGIPAVLSGAGPTVLALGTDLPEPDSLRCKGFDARWVSLAAAGARVLPG